MVYEKETEKFIPRQSFESNIFSEKEINILTVIHSKFGSFNATDLINKSHEELAWIKNATSNSPIDYSVYAPQLKAV